VGFGVQSLKVEKNDLRIRVDVLGFGIWVQGLGYSVRV